MQSFAYLSSCLRVCVQCRATSCPKGRQDFDSKQQHKACYSSLLSAQHCMATTNACFQNQHRCLHAMLVRPLLIAQHREQKRTGARAHDAPLNIPSVQVSLPFFLCLVSVSAPCVCNKSWMVSFMIWKAVTYTDCTSAGSRRCWISRNRLSTRVAPSPVVQKLTPWQRALGYIIAVCM